MQQLVSEFYELEIDLYCWQTEKKCNRPRCVIEQSIAGKLLDCKFNNVKTPNNLLNNFSLLVIFYGFTLLELTLNGLYKIGTTRRSSNPATRTSNCILYVDK